MSEEHLAAAAAAALGGGSEVAMPKPRLALGFRFHPTDEELAVYFLRRKVLQKPFPFQAIAELDIYSCEPWELQGFCAVNTRDPEWHFFTHTEKKYANGSKINRATSKGYWKATGKDRAVVHKSEIVAMKKTLVYYEGRAPAGRRTDWLMHEYRLSTQELEKAGIEQKDAFLLCKIYLKRYMMGSRGGVPLNEEEWENDADILVPCEDAEDEDPEVVGFNLSNVAVSFQGASSQQGFKSYLGIREREEDNDDDDEAAGVYLDKGKKPKLMLDLFSGAKGGGSDSSSSPPIIIIPDISQPTKAKAAAEFSSGLLDLSLSATEPKLKLQVQENHGAPPNGGGGAFNSSCLEDSLPPGYLKFITDLEEERDTLKHALMNSEATVSCLQAHNDRLEEEVRRLKSLLPKNIN